MALLRSAALYERGFLHGFPERDTDDAALLQALGTSRIAQAKQIHRALVLEASEATGALGREADALVARASFGAIGAGVRVADCVPVLVGDEESGDVVAIHAGWRGVVAGVVGSGVDALSCRDAARLVAAIGPCIGPCCFEVGLDVADAISAAAQAAPVVVRSAGDKRFVDLRAAVRAQLALAGVPAERIDDVAGCTKHEPLRFHSFRRDGSGSGRMLAAIAARRST